MKIVKAFGREFHASDDGRLLDQDGRPTRFAVMDLDVRHEAQPPHAFVDERRPGDSVAWAGRIADPGRPRDMNRHEHMLLIRDGRLVAHGPGFVAVM